MRKEIPMGEKVKKLAAAAAAVIFLTALTGCSSPGADNDTFDSSRQINVISREGGSGTRGAFIELMGIEEKGTDGKKTDRTTVEAIIANKTDVVLTGVAGDKYSIGYISLGSLNDSVKALSIDGAAASVENIKNKSYNVARPFNVAVRKGVISALAEDFIAFVMSREGQAVVAKGYIAVNDAAEMYSGSKPSGKLVIAGSSSVSPIMEKLVEAYRVVNTGAVIEVQTSDSTAGMTAARDGTCDIGMASRELKASELEELDPLAIALDGIAVIVNNSNPLDGLKSSDVRKIYIGEIESWDEVNSK
ncbi:MAG: substrate-binding domain-containing protein [Eubacteriales bacterium]|nr:substrate-binding domain-containing protein [Eubacteriales bacterium]